MKIHEILAEKGTAVTALWPEHSLGEVVTLCDQQHISSVVITDHTGGPIGIVTDRDVLHALARHGRRALEQPVTLIMHQPAPVCAPGDKITDVMQRMTLDHRRHVVVMDQGRIAGIASIGDLVKARLRDSDLESKVLREKALSRLAAE